MQTIESGGTYTNGHAGDGTEKSTWATKKGLAQMLKGG
jgi:hypothetical protein